MSQSLGWILLHTNQRVHAGHGIISTLAEPSRDEELSQKYSRPEEGKDILRPMFPNIWKRSGLGLNEQRSVVDKTDAKVEMVEAATATIPAVINC